MDSVPVVVVAVPVNHGGIAQRESFCLRFAQLVRIRAFGDEHTNIQSWLLKMMVRFHLPPLWNPSH